MKKKFLSLVCAALLAMGLPLALVGCKKSSADTIRINEVTRSVFYAPLYLADALGYFADEGYKIELTNGGGADNTMAAVLSGSADVGFCGPEAVVYTYLGGSGDAPKVFGQMTNCDGSFLVGRNPEPDFQWSDLEGKDVLAGRPGGVPLMTFQYICKEQNVTPNYITNVEFDSMTAAFVGGIGDYVTMFEPSASDYQKAGKGYIVAPVGAASGEVPYTCFMAKSSFIEKETGKVDALLRAVTKATKYIYEHDAETVAGYITKYFENTTQESVTTSLTNYKAINTWVTNMAMKETAFNRLQDIIQSAGELSRRVPFADIVLTQRANEIYQEVYA
ncbi:MAG: ABC transporter substrate-binding protein [Clostridiales bacterium]|nr:ABC transporter substrate-binding protein [Clostridiales bacterium]